MVLADSQKQFLLHLESYLVYKKEKKNMKLEIAINYVCYWLLFAVSTLKQALKECKTLDFSVFAAISLAVAFKRRKVDYV